MCSFPPGPRSCLFLVPLPAGLGSVLALAVSCLLGLGLVLALGTGVLLVLAPLALGSDLCLVLAPPVPVDVAVVGPAPGDCVVDGASVAVAPDAVAVAGLAAVPVTYALDGVLVTVALEDLVFVVFFLVVGDGLPVFGLR